MKMRNFITTFFVITSIYLLSMCQIGQSYALPVNGNTESTHNRGRGLSRYHSRSPVQYGRLNKADTIFNDFGDEDDIFDLSKRQQPPSDDYGHLRFGKRDERFDDYGHMRFGRNNGGDMK